MDMLYWWYDSVFNMLSTLINSVENISIEHVAVNALRVVLLPASIFFLGVIMLDLAGILAYFDDYARESRRVRKEKNS